MAVLQFFTSLAASAIFVMMLEWFFTRKPVKYVLGKTFRWLNVYWEYWFVLAVTLALSFMLYDVSRALYIAMGMTLLITPGAIFIWAIFALSLGEARAKLAGGWALVCWIWSFFIGMQPAGKSIAELWQVRTEQIQGEGIELAIMFGAIIIIPPIVMFILTRNERINPTPPKEQEV